MLSVQYILFTGHNTMHNEYTQKITKGMGGNEFCFLPPKLETNNSNCKSGDIGLSSSLDSWRRWRKAEIQRCLRGFHLGERQSQGWDWSRWPENSRGRFVPVPVCLPNRLMKVNELHGPRNSKAEENLASSFKSLGPVIRRLYHDHK